jgi:ankyrin repeat protein
VSLRSRALLAMSLSVLALSAAARSPADDLTAAAAAGDGARVRTLLAQGADPNTKGLDGTAPLAWTVWRQDEATAKALIEAGARVDEATRLGLRPLHLAIQNEDIGAVRLLLDAGADANSADPAGESCLMMAARLGRLDIIEALLARGARVADRDPGYGQTALMVAARHGHAPVVALLLAKGAEVDVRTRAGKTPAFRTPASNAGSKGAGIVRGGWPERGERDPVPGAKSALLYAAREGHVDVLAQLLDAGAAIELADADGVTPLLMAVLNGQFAAARVLLERGANVKVSDWYGQTPLFAAVDMRNVDVAGPSRDNGVDREAALGLIRELITRGADVNARTREYPPQRRWITRLGSLSWVDFTGQTPFLRAALAGDVTVMRLLLDAGADPRLATDSGTTPLMAAAGVNWVVAQTFDEGPEALLAAVKLCVERGNDVNAANSMGLRAVHGAANRGSNDIIQFLASKGARLDVADAQGRTPLTWAKGVFLATHPPEAKPDTIALLQRLQGGST